VNYWTWLLVCKWSNHSMLQSHLYIAITKTDREVVTLAQTTRTHQCCVETVCCVQWEVHCLVLFWVHWVVKPVNMPSLLSTDWCTFLSWTHINLNHQHLPLNLYCIGWGVKLTPGSLKKRYDWSRSPFFSSHSSSGDHWLSEISSHVVCRFFVLWHTCVQVSMNFSYCTWIVERPNDKFA